MKRCFYCTRKPIVYLRYADLQLCEIHFINYLENRVRKTIEKYNMIKSGDKILIAVSGGKDSTTLLHILYKLAKEYNFILHGLTIDLGIERYRSYIQVAINNYKKLGVNYTIFDLKKEYGFSLDDAVKVFTNRKPCSICGIIKRYIINEYAYDNNFDRIATGHTLDDITGLLLFHILRGNISYLPKLSPVLETKHKMVTRIKPLIETYEKDIELYARLKSFSIDTNKCPYYHNAIISFYKRIMDKIERKSPSTKILFLRSTLKRINPYVKGILEIQNIKMCKKCGMPTTKEICSFCRIRQVTLNGQQVK
ncbi:MAG: TIGR00269 family protein [Thermoproteales archaeon]|nr:TIGR00269 family protein [Thermoproteales archaeon]